MDSVTLAVRQLHRRVWVLGIAFLPFIALLVARLWWVQLRQEAQHVERITRQSVRSIRMPAVRGRILAAGGEVLVDNQPTFDAVFTVEAMRQGTPTAVSVARIMAAAQRLAVAVGRPLSLTETVVRRHLSWYPALPLTVFANLDERELTVVAECAEQFDGLEIRPGFRRVYRYPGTASHLLGFTGIRDPADAVEQRRYSYFEREPRGRDGLERQYDQILVGTPGRKTVRVDMRGYVHEEFERGTQPVDGVSLKLALDLRAQQVGERLMAEKTGALVLVDCRTGGVLAMVSSPSFSLTELSASHYAALAADEQRRPLFNRALAAGYLPGSIVKPLIALAGLTNGVIDAEQTIVHCPGFHAVGNRPIHCASTYGHGNLALTAALAQSCNTYFIAMGLRIGLEEIAAMMTQAGFGSSPGLDFPGGGGAGLVPSRAWAQAALRREWLAIDTAFISIGQGSVNISPLQAAMYAAAIANGGTLLRPFLVDEWLDGSGRAVRKTAPEIRGRLAVSAEHLAVVRDAMAKVVVGPLSSAPAVANRAISVAAKTGTAEVGAGEGRYKNVWLIGYAPVEAPQYAFALVVERGDSGGRTAAPIVGRLFEHWLGATEP